MRTHLGLGIMGLLAVLLAGAVTGRSAAAAPAQSESGMDPLATLSGPPFEIAFMSMMIPHHQAAVDMAKLVPAQGQHAELKATAQNILSSQSSEITEMTGWLQSWYSTAPQARWEQSMQQDMTGMGMTADTQKLASLQGDAFDRQFLLSMTPHHTMAVKMAQLVASRATHAELKTLAQNIIRSQTAEIGQFTGWLKTWYSQDMPGGMMGSSMPSGSMGGTSSTGGTMAGGTADMSGNSGIMPRTGQGPGVPPWLPWAGLAGIALVVGGLLERTGRRAQ